MMEAFVHWAAGFGLNYNFLLDAYQRGTLVQGALTTGWLCLFTIIGSLLAGISLAAMLTSGTLGWPGRRGCSSKSRVTRQRWCSCTVRFWC